VTTIALFDKAGLLTTRDLLVMARALDLNAQHRAAAWGFEPPVFVVRRDERQLQADEMALVFVTGEEGDPGALAVHFWDPFRGEPAGRVYVDRASGLNFGRYSVCESASHELEALNNPKLWQWRLHPDPQRAAAGVEIALEDSDPTQDTYEVVSPDEWGRPVAWRVANFVLPAWFQPPTGEPRRFDYAGRLSRPGEIGPEGYAVMRGPRAGGGREIWLEDNTGSRLGAMPATGRAGGKATLAIAGRAQRLLAGG
jgi:hypothetical protein